MAPGGMDDFANRIPEAGDKREKHRVASPTMVRLSWAASVAALAVLAGCDPIRQVTGTVRSVPPATKNADARDARPLAGVVVAATCGARAGMVFEDLDAGTQVLAISGPDGSFEHVAIGSWGESCVIEFESGDGSHLPLRFTVAELCRQSTGEPDCLVIKGINVALVRQRQSAPPVEVAVRTTAANIELRVDDSMTCQAPCQLQVTPGLHRVELLEQGRYEGFWREQAIVTRDTELTLRYEPHKTRQQVAMWFTLPIAAAAILAPVGLARDNETLLWTSAGLAVGGGVAFALVWKSDEAEVTVQPMPPANR